MSLSKLRSCLQEGLKQNQYKELIKNSGFGLELECIVPTDLMQRTGIEDAVSLLKFFYELKRENISKLNWLTQKEVLAITTIIDVFDNVPYKPFFGNYGEGRAYSGWRIETDGSLDSNLGVELITPSNKPSKVNQDDPEPNSIGISYEYAITEVVTLIKALKDLGFKADESTGLHIHVSYKDKFNSDSIADKVKELRAKGYSDFAIAAYVSSRESEMYFRKGDYNRKNSEYSQDLIFKIKELLFKEIQRNSRMFSLQLYNSIIASTVKEYLNRNNMNMDQLNSNSLILQLPATEFLKFGSFPEFFEDTLLLGSKSYLLGLMSGKHHYNYSFRANTLELRGLGGKNSWNQIDSKKGMTEILNLVLTQAYKINIEEASPKEILKATRSVLDEGLTNMINNALIRLKKDRIAVLAHKIEAIEIIEAGKIKIVPIKGALTKVLSKEGIGIIKGKKLDKYLTSNKLRYVYDTMYNKSTMPKKFELATTSFFSINTLADTNKILNSRSSVKTKLVDPLTLRQLIPEDLTLTLGAMSFLVQYIALPRVIGQNLSFDYGKSKLRFTFKFPSKENAQVALNFLTTYMDKAHQGSSKNPDYLGYMKVEDLKHIDIRAYNILAIDEDKKIKLENKHFLIKKIHFPKYDKESKSLYFTYNVSNLIYDQKNNKKYYAKNVEKDIINKIEHFIGVLNTTQDIETMNSLYTSISSISQEEIDKLIN